MDDASRKLLDDLDAGDVLEIDYYAGSGLNDVRTGVGVFQRYAKDERGEWVVRRENRPDIALIDIVSIRVLTQAGRPQ